MARIIAFDAGPTGLACGRPDKPEVAAILDWMRRAAGKGRTMIVLPEVVDYEVRRNLLSIEHGGGSVRRLDELVRPGGLLIYLPINTAAMRRAARLWSEARRGGYSTAGEKAIDGDVILAAQALEYIGEGDRLIVATGNETDLSRYVGGRAKPWGAITP